MASCFTFARRRSPTACRRFRLRSRTASLQAALSSGPPLAVSCQPRPASSSPCILQSPAVPSWLPPFPPVPHWPASLRLPPGSGVLSVSPVSWPPPLRFLRPPTLPLLQPAVIVKHTERGYCLLLSTNGHLESLGDIMILGASPANLL